ncbi:MAG: hypothetical protein CL910_19235 [Deltaproteobacteria bacterium]|nr:hypothetical protein [Deltaproteobacteria bacterium]
MSRTIVVLGATGEMGARVCRLIRRLAPTALLVGANRSGTGHAEFPIRKVDVADREGLAELLENADLVINAVGPYDYDPSPIIHAAISTHCHYADLAERLDFIEQVAALAEARAAAKAGVVLVPGCSTVPGLVAALAQRWKSDPGVAKLAVFLSMGSRNPVSRGLFAGMMDPIGRTGPGGRWFSRLVSHQTDDGRRLVFGSYPIAFSGSRLPVGSRSVPVRFHMGFDRGWINRGLVWAGRVRGRLGTRGAKWLAALLFPLAGLARPLGTERGVLSIVAEDGEGRERGRIEVVAASHGLDIPALPAAWLAQALVRDGWLAAPGLRGLHRVVSPEAAVAALVDAGYEVVFRPS